MSASGEELRPTAPAATGAGEVTGGGRMAVVLVNYASHQLLATNLDPGLAAAGHQVVVVDNFSSAEELTALSALAAERGWELVASPTNLGFGDGVNLGVERGIELGCEAFLALNPDAVITLPVLDELRREVLADHRALVSPRITRSNGQNYFRGFQLDYRSGRNKGGWQADEHGAGVEQEGRKPWLTAACLAFHRDAFTELGGFRGGYFLYWEDVDLTRRAAEAGMRLVLRNDLLATHDEGGTQDRADDRSLSSTYYYWNTRNRLLFAAEHLGRADLLRWILRTPAESRQILLRGGRRQLLHSTEPISSVVRGSLAGLAIAGRALVTGRRAAPGAAGVASSATNAPGSVLLAHPSPDLYGSDRVLLESVEALVQAGTRVTVALPGAGPLVDELRNRGAEVVFGDMPVLRKSALAPRGFLGLLATSARTFGPQLRLVRSSGAELVLVNTITIPMWTLVARAAGRPALVHVHEAEAEASKLVNGVLYAPLVFANHLVANSEFTRDVVAASYSWLRGRTTVVHNGVAGPGVEPARATLDAGVRLVCVGRLSPRKGPDVAVRALAEIRARGIDASLTLVGNVYPGYGWFEAELRELVASLGLDEHVTLAGFSSDVQPFLADASIVLVPSVGEESFGNTAVEALMAARPLVVSRTSGLAEATTGFPSAVQVAPGDASAIADAVAGIVASFGECAGQALVDAREAQRRYAPEVYRARFVELLGRWARR